MPTPTRHLAADGLPDDRITCTQCTQMNERSKVCRVFKSQCIPDLPRRCVHFEPIASIADRRNGKERWPDIEAQIAELRELERAHNAKRK